MFVRSPNLGWRDVPVVSILESKLDLPVHVENDANAPHSRNCGMADGGVGRQLPAIHPGC